jgi:hypothetical protein
MIATLQTGSPTTIGFKLSGKLHHGDYKSFVPTVEAVLAAQGKVRLFAQCHWALQNQPAGGASKPASWVHAW